MTDPGDWFVSAFDERYLHVYAHRDDGAAEREIGFVARVLDLRPGARLLDAGCGAGRHSRALTTKGAAVVGMDLSDPLLRKAAGRGGGPRYVRADLRALPFAAATFDHVTSLFTTFGYFDHASNDGQLLEFRRVLRPGATLLLDYLNPVHVRRTLVPESERVVGDLRISERRRVTGDRVEKDVEVSTADGDRARWTESVALYERGVLEERLRRQGLEVREAYGDLTGAAWTDDRPRTVLLAEAR